MQHAKLLLINYSLDTNYSWNQNQSLISGLLDILSLGFQALVFKSKCLRFQAMKPFPKENLKMSAKVTFFAFFKTRSTRNPIYNCLTYDLQLSLKPHLELNVCKLVCSLRTTHLSRTQLLLILTSCLNIISLDFARLANDFKPCNCIFIKRNSK